MTAPAIEAEARPQVVPRPASRATTVWRWRLVAGCLVLAALVFRQSPGLVVPDTKLDLTANPGGLLTRALDLWDANGLGQLQNQAYGYLFPMGPFHWVLHELGLEAWVVQRLWWALVLSVAFVGFWRLAGALGIGRPAMRYAGAFLFALTPHLLSEVAITSVEVWPMAVAPWVLAPLVDRRERPWWSRVRASALAFGCIGGVNAVATGVALVLPTLWLLTRAPAWRVGARWLGWLATCLLAGAWWIGPLLLLGRYSPPFLDWIEDASVTTGMSSIFNAFQGTSAWLDFLAGPTGPSWPAGWLFVTQPVLILATAAVAAIGLAGLATRDVPERSWLVLSAVTGLALLTMGFVGVLAPPWAHAIQGLLDGVLAAARNTHKFEVVLRLPLLLALVHVASRPLPSGEAWRTARRLRPVLAGLLVVAAAAPSLAMKLPRPEGYTRIPDHWYAAARWLDSRPDAGSVLVLPAASFADFAWGSTKDEPLQALSHRPFVVRDAVPLGAAGTTRLLDEIVRRIGNGMGGPELRTTLAGMGVRYVVVRNDLRLDVQGNDAIAVHEALAESGLDRVADFGLTSQSIVESPTRTVNERTVLPYPSVEIFDVGDRASGNVGAVGDASARLVPKANVLRAVAGPENLPALSGVLGSGRAFLMGSDPGGLAFADDLPTVLTDGNRRQEVFFGRPAENVSPTLTALDPGRQGRRTLGYVSDERAGQTTLSWEGIAGVDASSSASDADATLRLGPAFSPGAAVDGNPSTRWVSGRFQRAVGEWLEVSLDAPRSVEGTTITVSNASPVAAPAALVRVDTDSGSTTVLLKDESGPQPLITPTGPTQRLRVTLLSTAGTNLANGFGIAEIHIPGVTARARLDLPAAPSDRAPSAVVMGVQDPGRSGCLFVAERPLCAERFVRTSPEADGLSRAWSAAGGATYAVSGSVLPASGAALDRLLDVPGSVTAEASSRRVPGPAGRPAAAVDADLGTGWVASSDDPRPSLTLRLPERREVDALQFVVDRNLAASSPRSVRVLFDGRDAVRREVDSVGRVRFPARRVKEVTVQFLDTTAVQSVEAASGFRSVLPVGVSEVLVDGAEDLVRKPDPGRTVRVPCGFGPTVTLDGAALTTEVSGTARQVLRGEPLDWRVCGTRDRVDLRAGRHVVDARSTAEFVPYELSLNRPSRKAAPTPELGSRGGAIGVPSRADDALLVVDHNFNRGWRATTDTGTVLQPVRVDGWQQGYVVPAGAAVSVREVYAPGSWYRWMLALGLAALVGLVVVSVVRRGRGRPEPPLATAEDPGVFRRALPSAVLVVVAGLPALIALVVAEVVDRLVPRWGPWLVLGLGVLAGVVVAGRPWLGGAAGVNSMAVQLLVLTAFALAVRHDSRRRPQRMIGRSTSA